MVRRTLSFLCTCALAIFVGAPAATAQDIELAATLGAGSELVVAGRVSHVESRWDPAVNCVYGYITIQIVDTLKGTPEVPLIVVKQLGGVVGTIGLHIEGQASFAAGEDVVLFLAVRPRDGTLYTAGFELGKWRLLTDLATGNLRAVPPAASGTLAPDERTPGLDLGNLRAVVEQTPSAGASFVTMPPEARLAAPSHALLPTGGPPARWHQADDNVAVEVGSQQDPGGLPGGAISAVQNAINRWNAGGTRLQLQFIGPKNVSPPCDYGFVGDGRIRVYFNDPCGEISDDDPSVFGIGGGFYTTGDLRTINGTEFQKFLQGLAVLNNVGPHLASAGCYQDAMTHKIGHAIGLGHSGAAGSVMSASLPSGCSGGSSNLGQDDVNGLGAIYPAIASGPNPPQPPTTFSGSVLLNSVSLQWTPANTGGPADSYLIEAGSAPGLSNLATLVVNAPATSTSVGNVPQGVYFVRVRARNVIATSAPSPETMITVGPCEAPGTPTSFSAAVADTFVNLNWVPPASGGPVQGYRLAVGSAPGLSNLFVQVFPPAPTTLVAVAPFGDYYARLFARNTCGESSPTPDLLVRVQPCSAPPNAPSSLTFARSGNQVTLHWTPPAGGPAPSRYVLVVGSVPGAADLLVQPTPHTSPTFVAVGPSGTYFVRVLAQNACGNSGFSSEVQVVIP